MSRQRLESDILADKIVGWTAAALFLGGKLAHDVHKENSTPVLPGVVLGKKRTGSRKDVTIPWQSFCHVQCTGATGGGKSTMLLNFALQHIKKGHGITVISPKGDLIQDLLPHIPDERVKDTILFDATDQVRPPTFNVLDEIDPQMRSRAASEVLTIFKRFYSDSWGPRLEHFLRFSLLALLECPHTTLASIPTLFLDSNYRQQVLTHVTNPLVLQFWEQEYAAMSPAARAQATAPILNKVSSLLAYPQVNHILANPRSSVRISQVMDQSRILLINLPQGLLGEDASAFLGGLFISKIQLAAMHRASLPSEQRRPHILFIDEFQNFGGSQTATDSTFAKIFTEARAFNLSLFCAHQYDSQLSRQMLDAVAHNVGVSLKCQVEKGVHTVLYRQPQDPTFEELPLTPLPPLGPGNPDIAASIIQHSQLHYGRPFRQKSQPPAASKPAPILGTKTGGNQNVAQPSTPNSPSNPSPGVTLFGAP